MKKPSIIFFKKKSLSSKAITQSKCEEKEVILSSDFSRSMPATVRTYNKFTDLLVTSITTKGLLNLSKLSKFNYLYA